MSSSKLEKKISFYNTLSRKKEEFIPINKNEVGMYTCGPTVYDYVSIGNWRTYALGDIVARTLKYSGYKVSYFMNITDVGHLTGDNLGDADLGEDRMEKAKKREGKNAWEIAKFYSEDFLKGYKKLNLTPPEKFLRATDYIKEQIDLVKRLEKNGLTYKINDGIYFDTTLYEKKGFKYGELSNLDQIKAGARVELNEEKRSQRDFALWKFSPKNEKRDMEWESPWGVGFPGWHIECSAMSMKFLGEQFDIHIGGEDLKSTHHPNEIAQSEGATGKSPFVRCWIHGAFLKVNGGRMGKSLGNTYNLHDIDQRKINPLALRYFYLGAHYSSSLNFTWEVLEAVEVALKRLYALYLVLGDEIGQIDVKYQDKFKGHLENDLDMPRALATLWDVFKDEKISAAVKKATVLDFDQVLGLGFINVKEEEIPEEVQKMMKERDEARKNKDFKKSDELRDKIKSLGYEVKDSVIYPS